ncbi:MAG: alpha/beta fold hydrolase, partial [bacterium]|nr:alpha/beta fold hydrolase [bacterium]
TPGFGYSDKPDRDYGMEFLCDCFTELLARLEIESCALVGNSHGGALAISLALREPALVSKLILMAPGGLEERDTYMKMRGIRAMLKAVFSPDGITRESMRAVFGLQIFDSSQISDQLIEERLAIASTQPKRVLSTLNVPYLAPELARLEMPVLGLWGADDQFCPVSGATRIVQSCPDARVIMLSRCGHWVMVEHPELFAQACLEFLRGEAPG